ncbi:MAG: hypothetical protein U0S48_14555 [Solirubrobacteraceae bacterium]
MLDPAITEVLARLSEIAATNTVGAIQTRVAAAKATRQHEHTVSELTEIINQLVEDRGELVGIANALREQLVAQRITAEEIKYIEDKLIPTVETLSGLAGDDDSEGIAAIKALVSVEMLTVLQLVGFNFKAAIGEPLTQVVETWIRQLAPSQPPIPQKHIAKRR